MSGRAGSGERSRKEFHHESEQIEQEVAQLADTWAIVELQHDTAFVGQDHQTKVRKKLPERDCGPEGG